MWALARPGEVMLGGARARRCWSGALARWHMGAASGARRMGAGHCFGAWRTLRRRKAAREHGEALCDGMETATRAQCGGLRRWGHGGDVGIGG